MREVGVLEAKTHLSALLEEVEAGSDVLITRHGRPVARVTQVREAALRKQMTGEELVARVEAFQRRLIDEGVDPTPESWEDVKATARR